MSVKVIYYYMILPICQNHISLSQSLSFVYLFIIDKYYEVNLGKTIEKFRKWSYM